MASPKLIGKQNISQSMHTENGIVVTTIACDCMMTLLVLQYHRV